MTMQLSHFCRDTIETSKKLMQNIILKNALTTDPSETFNYFLVLCANSLGQSYCKKLGFKNN